MDDGELDFSNQILKNMEHHLLSSFNDDTHARTHINTSDQPERDMLQNLELPHSADYIHFGTKTLPMEGKATTEETDESVDQTSKKRPQANRESVRKYRERKKARRVSMEDELIRLRIVNQQLLKRLQGLVALEQEVARFKCLLVEIRGRIKGELGSFPFHKPATGDVNQRDHQYTLLD